MSAQNALHPLQLVSITSALLCGVLSGCVNYQPRQLVPSISLSAEKIDLPDKQTGLNQNPGVDFGLDLAVNESDSLSNIEILPGARVRAVNPGSAASSAGIQPGDVILAIDDLAINHPDTVDALAQQTSAETEFKFQLRRNTTVLEASVLARPTTNGSTGLRELYRVDPIASRAGYRTQLLTVRGQNNISAAAVVEILNDSPLPRYGFGVGDMIIAVNNEPVGSAQGLITRLNTDFELGSTVSMTVLSDDQLIERRLKLWDPGRRINRISLIPLMRYESTVSPQSTSFSLLDFWLFAVYRYNRTGGERQHKLFELFSFSSDYGQLIEDLP